MRHFVGEKGDDDSYQSGNPTHKLSSKNSDCQTKAKPQTQQLFSNQSVLYSIMLKKVLLAAALMGSTLANPLPSDDKNPLASHQKRTSVPEEDMCSKVDGLASNSWQVYATKSSMPIDQVCGQGYLDNFRGRCGVISSWGCEFVDRDVNKVEEKEKNEDQIMGAKMTFDTQFFCSTDDIIEAMGAASADNGHKPKECFESPKFILPRHK
ncbi:hypothetical protein P168DRAFT_117252 [Aspergillus campestris IBT 28561]|uniref:Uncharacterized protein n=1 Tax=Aspergillus campestris (strain IBT 28561) TaxID=1392248 RepID=A0A2I1D9Y2_ASPC2|nr:uncharacterized protein P168DRAFT_117252 [Aspergillus campestris IBT 28561]PKY06685.1 hypothetical protein P168DRAFT_117252 [Aspergillus campestris IBT 28561]